MAGSDRAARRLIAGGAGTSTNMNANEVGARTCRTLLVCTLHNRS